jgi:hypothetical protein
MVCALKPRGRGAWSPPDICACAMPSFRESSLLILTGTALPLSREKQLVEAATAWV